MSIKREFENLLEGFRKDPSLKIIIGDNQFVIHYKERMEFRFKCEEKYLHSVYGLMENVAPDPIYVHVYYNFTLERNDCWAEQKQNPTGSSNFEHVGFLTTEELIKKVKSIIE